MNVSIETLLMGVAQALNEKLLPELRDYTADSARLAALIVEIAAKSVDDAAALRVAENAGIRALFSDAYAFVGGELGGRLAAAAQGDDPGLRISELDAENARLRQLLVELHAEVDNRDGAEAQETGRRIWRLLRDMEARRAPPA
jgi:hypothetical protein